MKLCSKCNTPMLAVPVGDGNVRYTCPQDGETLVEDKKGRQYLADGGGPSPRRALFG